MKAYIVILLLASFACAEIVKELIPGNTAYGYIENIGIPTAEKIRIAEESEQNKRIIGGTPAATGQFEFQVGLLIAIQRFKRRGVCGGTLISRDRVVTAAHCWFDGRLQASTFEVVLGSARLFSGGVRIKTNDVILHPQWIPAKIRNDVAVVYLPRSVDYSSTIGPVDLPTDVEVHESFVGRTALASGFGRTVQNGVISASLRYVKLSIITNGICRLSFPSILTDNNICTSGLGDAGTCQGDSGGPLVVQRNGRQVLVGITSFGSALGCQSNMPSVYVRVTSFIGFIRSHL